jgi:nucleoside-diphosphate-sugar epimerase
MNKKSLIYKGDAAQGIMKAVERTEKSGAEIYNLTAEAVSMREIVETLAGALGKKTPRIKIPENLARAPFLVNKTGIAWEGLKKIEKTLEKWLSDDIFSGKKFNEEFNFRAATPISEALARQVEFYLEQKGLVKV